MNDRIERAKMTLYDYGVQQNAVKNLPDMIRTLESEAYGIKAAQTDKIAVSGGGSGDDKMAHYVAKLEELRLGYTLAAMEVRATQNALNALSEEERTILSVRYINHQIRWEDDLCERLHCDRSTLFRKHRIALRRYTIARLGTC